MNIYQKINVKVVNLDILKQKKKLVYIADQKKLEVQGVMNAVMKRMKIFKIPIILFAKIVLQWQTKIIILRIIIYLVLIICIFMNINSDIMIFMILFL